MRAHYLQHVPFEGLGSIENWLQRNGYAITSTRFYEHPDVPEVDGIDLLIVMGGPMSVNDEAEYPWIVAEKAFIRAVVAANKPVLGICLGAQLIASALGAAVYPNTVKEIGWFPVRATDGKDARFQFPETVDVFHWHGETFDLPPRAIQLAESDGCQHQAFQIGDRVMGLQFHLETTPASVQALTTHCRDELVAEDTIQSAETMLAAPPDRYETINGLMADILEYLHNA